MSIFLHQILEKLGVSRAATLQVARQMSVASFSIGDVICASGSKVDHWQMIVSGIVASTVPIGDNGRVPIMVYGQYAWFGEQAILDYKPSYLEYVCLNDVDVVRLPTDVLLALLRQEVALAGFLARTSAWHAHSNMEMLVLRKLGTPAVRVVMGLTQVAEGLMSQREYSPIKGDVASLPLKQEVLAQLCGVSRTTFSECVHMLQGSEWLSIGYNNLSLLSMEVWHHVARKLRARIGLASKLSINDLIKELDQAAAMR